MMLTSFDDFNAELEIEFTREGLFSLLEKAGYKFPINEKTIITVSAEDKRNSVVFYSDKKQTLKIRLENDS